jgi:ABC-2 type transport system permease protein
MRLYLRLITASIRARLQYKWDFLLTTVLHAFGTAIDFLTVAAILFRYHSIAGWNIYEVALLSGTISAAHGLFRLVGAELNQFERYLVTGEFDQLLTRPWQTLPSLLSRSFDLGRVGGVLQGYLVLGIGLKGVLAAGAPGWIVPYVLTLPLAGLFIDGAVHLMTATAGFWITRIDELQTFTINAPLTAANYPAEIYPNWLRYLLTGVLPMLTMGYIPMRYALGKGGGPLNLAVPYLTAVLMVVVSLRLWGWGERRYQSTGN